MKKLTNLYSLFLTIPIILNAQWIQTGLNPGIGYCLYSNDTTIYAGTNEGVFYTNDIGDPWYSIGPEDLILSLITAGNTLIAGSDAHGIWISSNMGEDWAHPAGMDNKSIRAFCKNDSFIFAGTWGNGVFRSRDNGNSWQYTGLDEQAVEALYATGDTIFAGGEYTDGVKVNFSFNNGNSWDYRFLPWPASRVYCLTYKDGKIFAGSDGIYASTDMGDSWSLEYGVTFDTSGNVTDWKIFKELMVYDNYLIAALLANSIWISSDNGKNWTDFNTGLMSDWTFEGLAVKGTDLWALRSGFGNAYRRSVTELSTGIYSERNNMPEDYLLFQNYPNPFNSSTIIEYKIPDKGYVSLKIYDLLGHEIATLVNEVKSKGVYQISFKSDYLTSGTYFYILKIGEKYSEAKKMLLLK
ncbi:MAG: T9SS type A sorting domain-containing protein [Calditrichaceae bacterium]|nr:T9SS type A sorting domain-containing protein [Calditrichaceae bacterium]MBN2710182.1 T9SS type A sorting domain-containing protein [Calditrichaceae bacterium]RQV94156.1 MAG: T9SS C-terminal target domain-containing protein [Calditrichota bacterium]